MPSARTAPGYAEYELPSDNSEDDPDYREDSDDGDEDDLPHTMGRDRALWFIDNRDALVEVYRALKEVGTGVFGSAFLQCGSLNAFGNFVYKYTTPGAT
jgi:hypothetical protein